MKALFFALMLGGLGVGGYYFYSWYFEPQESFLETYRSQPDAPVPPATALADPAGDAGAFESSSLVELAAPADEPSPETFPAALIRNAGGPDVADEAPAPVEERGDEPSIATEATPEPGSPVGRLAGALLGEDDLVVRAKILREVMKKHPESLEAIDVVEQEATRVRESGDIGLEWEALSFVFFRLGEGHRRDGVRDRLHEITDRIIFSRRPGPYSNLYRIQPGDSLQKIAERYYCPIDLIAHMNGIEDLGLIHQGERIKVIQGAREVEVAVGMGETLESIADAHDTTVETLIRLNNLAGTTVEVGDRLKVRRSAFDIVVSKSEFTLTVIWHGLFARQYRVGIGADGRTPTGIFGVRNRIPNPPWWKDGQRIPAGDPRNILGTMWLGFEDTREVSGIGIHGTKEPDSIGTEASAGCIRMRNEEVNELALITPIGTKVRIVD